MSEVKLHSDMAQFLPQQIFTESLWHPGYQDQSKYACLVHALNMFVGGPLFDTPEKFLSLYQSRSHMIRVRSPEFRWENGLSLKNLKKILYYEKVDTWLSPVLKYTATSAFIQENTTLKIGVNEFLNFIEEPRVLIQFTTLPDYDDETREIVKPDCHAAVLQRISDAWILLDSAEEGPINFKDKPKLAQKWLEDISMLNIVTMVND